MPFFKTLFGVKSKLLPNSSLQTTSRQHPFHYAISFACVLYDENCIATLLQAEADVYVKDKNDVTPLHILAQGTVE
jgi:ankyrin repeat protein